MSTRAAAILAWSAWAASAALSVGGLVLMFVNGSLTAFFEGSLGIDAVVGITYPAVGAVICSRRPGNTVGWLFCLVGFLLAATVFAGEYARFALVTGPGTLPAGVAAAWVGTWAWIPGVVLNVTFLLLLFPHGRLPSPRWRPVAYLIVALTALGTGYVAVLPWSVLEVGLPAQNPFEVEGSAAIESVVFVIVVVLGLASLLLSLFALGLRFRRAAGTERQQVKWFVYAGGLYVLTILVPVDAVQNLQVLAAPLLPVALGVAILRHRLYDIDEIINRTIVYGALTASLVATYLGGVTLLQWLFRALTGQEQQPQLVVVASTLAIAALFNPLRRGIQGAVDRRFYRKKYDARKTLEEFSAKLRDGTDLGRLGEDLAGVARETMQPAHVSLWLREPAAEKRTETRGR